MIAKWANRFQLKPGRWIYEPTTESVEIGREIKAAIEAKWRPPGYYYHFRSGGHLAAVKTHFGNTTFWHGDIENFFGSINRSRLTRCLKPLVGYKKAREWAIQSTVPNPDKSAHVLPYGFIQSQLLASLCLRHSALGKCLHELRNACSISVYVDDIIASSNGNLASESALIVKAAARSEFTLGPAKLQGPAAEIAAFNIAIKAHSIALTDRRWTEFKVALADPACSEERRQALITYINLVDPARL